jgi:hypothetical protein
MMLEQIIGIYVTVGIVVAIINGAIRNIEADALLGFAWIIVWPLTPIGYLARLLIYVHQAVKAYQPYRRTKIYFLKRF